MLQFSGVTVDRSFDIWSLGMAVLHLYVGKSYFQDSSDPKVGGIYGADGISPGTGRYEVRLPQQLVGAPASPFERSCGLFVGVGGNFVLG